MTKFHLLFTTCLTSICLMVSCTTKSPADFADEYNSLVTKLEQTTDSSARNEILRQMADIQLDVRGKLKKDELKEFLKLIKPIDHESSNAEDTIAPTSKQLSE